MYYFNFYLFIYLPLQYRSVHNSVLKNQQEWLARKRVVVEQFFGRMKTIMGITRTKYPFQKDSMDMDMQICVWLTNQHILQHHLSESDGQLYTKYIRGLQAQVGNEKMKKSEINRVQALKRRKMAEENAEIIAAGDTLI